MKVKDKTKEHMIKFKQADIEIIQDALYEALEGAVHFDKMEENCPHCKFVEAIEILGTRGETENSPLQCSQCGMIQPVYIICSCGNTIGIR